MKLNCKLMREPLQNAEKKLAGLYSRFILTVFAIIIMAINLSAQTGTVQNACTCQSNQSRAGDGQFIATINVNSDPGETWYIVLDSINGFFDDASPAPPAQTVDYITGPGGVTIDETALNSGIYTLDGIHIDGQGFWVDATNGTEIIRIQLDAGTCNYPRTKIVGDPFVCEGQVSDYETADNAGSSYHWTLSSGGAMDPANGNANPVTISWDNSSNGTTHSLEVTENAANGCIVSDQMDIMIEDTITMACNDDVQISLDLNCGGELTADMFLEDMQYEDASYDIILEDANGNLVNQDTLSSDMVGKKYTVTVQHKCSSNMCWSHMLVLDKTPPELNCKADTIGCADSDKPEDLDDGYPLVEYTNVQPITGKEREYIATGTNSCTDLTLKYYDEVEEQSCDSEFSTIIYRTWIVKDAATNLNTCVDTINLRRESLADISYPHHWDGLNGNPFIQACSAYAKDANDNPAPSYTGAPQGTLCGNIMINYSDQRLKICGESDTFSYKVLRTWLVMDMCTGEAFDTTQFIKIMDTQAPSISVAGLVHDTLSKTTDYYDCGSNVVLPSPTITDCSMGEKPEYTVGYQLPDENGDFPDLSFPFTTVHKVADKYTLPNITGGKVRVKYTATDPCGNIGEEIFYIRIHDNLPPQAVCDKHTTITLSEDGIGYLEKYTFDDGSYDNCSAVTLQVKRDNSCDPTDTQWGEGVHFCCSDSGKDSIEVTLLVTDKNGLTNTCTALVKVSDKEKPVIHCPSSSTVSCKFDISDLSVFGTVRTSQDDVTENYINDSEHLGNHLFGIDGYATDNCNVTINSSFTPSINIDNCGVGTIKRTFRATDSAGNSDDCTQTIYVRDFEPFNANNTKDLTWPRDYPNYTGCFDDGILPDNLPDIYGWPKIIGDDHCSMIAMDYDDLVFEHVDGMCKKILRTWRVVDWCKYEENNTGNTDGYWEHTQVIMLNDNQNPVVTSGCTPVDITPLGNCLYRYHFKAYGSDNCTNTNDIAWTYKININLSNSNIITGETDEFNANLSKGTHKITWYAEDECGNIGQCSRTFTVADNKAPTPQCIDGLVTVVLPETGKIKIYAADFNRNSTDDCTRSNYGTCGCLTDLHFSFSSNKNETSKWLDCSDIENGILDTINLEMWVTDESGNQDFCNTFIILQDNSDACPDVIPPHDTTYSVVSGRIIKPNDTPISGATLELTSSNSELLGSKITDNDGKYTFRHLADNLSYNLTAKREGDDNNGLSTLDIVLIQKHLLNIKEFKNTYQYIAADVNHSGTISAADILELRKMILGVNDKFKNNNSWRFVAKDYSFDNKTRPYNFNEVISIDKIEEDMNKDIVAIKIGDINNSAITNTNGLVFRNANNVKLIADNADYSAKENFEVEVFSQENFTTIGTQFTIKFDPTLLEFRSLEQGQFSISNVNINSLRSEEGIITISWNTKNSIDIDTENALFKLNFGAKKNGSLQKALSINSEVTKAEIYTIEENTIVENQLTLNYRGSDEFAFKVFQNVPNPFNSKTTIGFEIPKEQKVTLNVYDVTGKTLYRIEKNLPKGFNEFKLSNKDIKATGLMYYKLEAGANSAIRKMILIK